MARNLKIIFAAALILPALLLGTQLIIHQASKAEDLKQVNHTSYTISLNISNTPAGLDTSTYQNVAEKPSRETYWQYQRAKDVSSGHVLLAGSSSNPGSLANISPITGVVSLTTLVSGQPLALSGAYELSDEYSFLATLPVGSNTYSFTYGFPYLRLSATANSGESQITMLALNYSCAPVEVASVALSLESGEEPLYIGETLTLKATVNPLNATNGKVNWSSSDNSVATVNNGLVRAQSIGSATIKATSSANLLISDEYEISVIAVPQLGTITIPNLTANVNIFTSFNPVYANIAAEHRNLTFDYANDYIYFTGDYASGFYVEGALAGTTTSVTATTANGISTTFNVTVASENHSRYYDDSSWTNNINVTKISNINEDFVRGIDISEVYENSAKGAKYYNTSGVRQDVYQILKNNGVTHARIRLWNDPYLAGSSTQSYGGGICDLPRVITMAKGASRAGLKILLDFHYSDFWAHPDQQVVPKAWKDFTTVAQFEAAFKSYSKAVMQSLLDEGVSVDIAQVGNEISSGLVNQIPSTTGASTAVTSNDKPNYIQNMTWLPWASNIVGIPWDDYTNGLTNLRKYVIAAISGIKEVSQATKIALHLAYDFKLTKTWARDFFVRYFGSDSGVNYDIVGLSYYPMYHGSLTNLTDSLTNIKNNGILANKRVMILENSYGFTTQNNPYLNNQFSALSGYATSIQGQANEIRDVMNALVSIFGANSTGMFMWAGCWTPVSGVGWAGSGTVNTWANQAMFSYDGRALPSLEVFNRVY